MRFQRSRSPATLRSVLWGPRFHRQAVMSLVLAVDIMCVFVYNAAYIEGNHSTGGQRSLAVTGVILVTQGPSGPGAAGGSTLRVAGKGAGTELRKLRDGSLCWLRRGKGRRVGWGAVEEGGIDRV